MENGTINYLQHWGNQIARRFRSAWNGELVQERLGELFDPSLIFHFHDQKLHGLDAYRAFMQRARQHAPALDLAEELVLSHAGMVQLYFRWKSPQWHPDIVAGQNHSNYCTVVMRVKDGRIAELWQQIPDFLFLLGKQHFEKPMLYPQVVPENMLLAEEGCIRPCEDAQSQELAHLFRRMNDCFMNRASLREMLDIQNKDIEFHVGGGNQGSGVQSWKTFAYALHTCLGEQKGTRFDDVYVREGGAMRVFARAAADYPSPFILNCAEGMIACLKLTSRDGKIATLSTQIENYVQFLDTDFSGFNARLVKLFQGRREPVAQAVKKQAAAHAAAAPQAAAASQRPGVAIVGMAGRFPGCDSVAALWDALAGGDNLISPVPQQRAYLKAGTDIAHAGFIDGVDQFDAAFFQIMPTEAPFMDPQQRLLLQEILHSIEDSGHAMSDFAGERTGVFVACQSQDYQKLLQDHGIVHHPQSWAGNEGALFPSKVARFLNIQGPCKFINAECAASLTALHEAARLIREGRIDQAIVGASNLLLHSYGFGVRRDALLTGEPQASPFSRHSKGQLRGEAVVALVLKSLDKAEADGDHIYGMLAGSALNNSGRTLSLAAGNIDQQARVMRDAWSDAGVQAGQVSLIECHASGIRGGDFAELAAIRQALGGAEAPQRPCQLSSMKAALGHAEAASGLTAVVKILLQMQHKQIVGTRGLDDVDPELPADPQRFQLAQGVLPWEAAAGARRVAGINSFAGGGYNAHVVIAEYPRRASAAAPVPDSGERAAVLLSAHCKDSLMARLRDLRAYLGARPATSLRELACTLRRQDAMKYRAAFVTASVAELVALIDTVLEGRTPAANVFVGQRKGAGPAAVTGDLDLAARAEHWSRGAPIAWPQVGPAVRRLRDLPPYPFDTRSFWVEQTTPNGVSHGAGNGAGQLHPLVHRNVSTLYGQRYRTSLSSRTALVSDHVVMGRPMLPAVAYLEMVRAAVLDALGLNAGPGELQVQLRHVIWLHPISFDGQGGAPVDVELTLTPLVQAQSGAPTLLTFEISTPGRDVTRLHCQGQVALVAAQEESIDVAALQARCAAQPIATADQLYAAYAALGIAYGPAYRAVHALYRGVDAAGAPQLLSRIDLPPAAQALTGFVIHPVALDAAMHSAIGLLLGEGAAWPSSPPLPFAIESVDVLGPCSAHMWARISQSAADEDTAANVRKLDIDLLDADGRLCVRVGRLGWRTGEEAEAPVAPESAPVEGGNESLERPVLAFLAQQASQMLQVDSNDLDTDETLSNYGFDSVNLTEFGNRLNEQYRLPLDRPLNPTMFFEHPTLARFARFLVRRYPVELAARHAQAEGAAPPAAKPQPSMRTGIAPAVAMAPAPNRGADRHEVAIVGMSGRFPMASDIAEYWRNLVEGRDCISEVPAARWDWREIYGDPNTEGNLTDVKWGGFIDGVDEFDPLFFGISPREALYMDPMQRLLMQHAWHAIEDAGYAASAISGTRTGVFVGTAASEYSTLLKEAGVPNDAFLPTGRGASLGANRLSYLLNLTGPSETVDTACSSSLVAIHRAVQAIESGDCAMALVGGVNLLLAPDGHVSFRKAGVLSEDGRCKTFSSAADGYVRGEGAGMLFLKRLSDAERDGDNIYGLVRGSGDNHGGRASSLTAPNPIAQADLVKRIYAKAGVDPRTVGFIEAHGTGTALGDPIEINALKMAFDDLYQDSGNSTVSAAHCGLGSAKSNIGHLELAAGVAGAIKVLLQLKHRILVKSLHAEQINPYIDLAGSPFYVVRETAHWPAPLDCAGRELPRRAGLSSFGIGGTNAHVLFEEYRAPAAVPAADGQGRMIVLSAKNEERLRDAARVLLAAVAGDGADLDRIAYTLQVGREAFDERLAVSASTLQELRDKLTRFLAGGSGAAIHRGKVSRHDHSLAMLNGDELRTAIASWLAKKQLDNVLAFWVRGSDIDWMALYADRAALPRRVSLPGYPFARERHWPQPGKRAVPVSSARSVAYLQKTWTASVATPGERPSTAEALILASDQTMALARLVSARVPGLIVNLSDAARIERLEGAAGCIDLTGCAAEAPGPLTSLPWLQQLAAQRTPLMVLGVSRGLEACGNAAINLAGASRAGLFRMLQSEYPKLRSRHLDLDPAQQDEAAAVHIAAEWHCTNDDAEACYRKDQRYVAQLKEVALPAQAAPIMFAPGEVLWITGGTRGIGLLCANHFAARHGVRKLVLTGRDALPPRAEWAHCLATGSALSNKIAAIQKLEGQGVQVETLALAGADSAAVQAQVRRIEASMGPIAGVLHCAGLTDFDNPAFIRKGPAAFAAVLEPKVGGLDALLSAMRHQPLKFFALFSSVSSAIPSLGGGQSDYSAANAYMDYVAMANAASCPIVSIQWPSWKETGMGEATTAAYRQTGLLSHTDAEGLQLLDSVLAHKAGPVILPAMVNRATFDPRRLMQRAPEATASAKNAHVATAAPTGDLAAATLAWLASMFAKELMVPADAIERDTPFQDYGVDSIMLTQVLRRVDGALMAHGKTDAMDPSVFYEYPTLNAFTQHLMATWPAPLAAALGAVPAPVADAAPLPPPATEAQLASRAPSATGDFAVVGLSCRFPGADDLDAFWRLLAEGRSAIGPVPAQRWGRDTGYRAGLLRNVADFDPGYFLLSDSDAKAMDPQALLLLEETLATLHHAGYTAREVKGSATGVYIGARSAHRPEAATLAAARNPIIAVGPNYLAANISQFFDLQGPSLVLDTACSSALVAMNMALQSLQAGDISAALVGGVSILQTEQGHQLFDQRKLLCATDEFHVFDGRSNGVVLGEGVGMVMIKSLQQAINDGDQIHAVIKGLAINNDGRTAGPATPNLMAQKAVMQQALRKAGMQPDDISYIHVNGSGSEVTDLLELKAMQAVYRAAGHTAPCELGSMEPNIGHPLCAKGIAGFIQLVLMLSRRQGVPFLSGQQAMAHYDIDSSPFHFGRELTDWRAQAPVAALNCFADGGTNVHVILQAWHETTARTVRRAPLGQPHFKRRTIYGAPQAAATALDDAWNHTGQPEGRLHLTADHPVLRNHAAYGQQLLPGLAYIDILYQHFERMGLDLRELELRNLSIYTPLIVGADVGVQLDVNCVLSADGKHWQVQLEGREQRGAQLSDVKRYAVAEMHRAAAPRYTDVIDLEQVRRDARSTTDLQELYAQCVRQGLNHTGIMKGRGKVHECATATHIEVSVGPEAFAGAAAFRFHPTLIDGSSVGAASLFAAFFEGEDRLILPLHYESFRASAPLQTACTTRVAVASLRRKNDLIYMNMEFFDAAGAKVAELNNYACKLVRDEGAINPERKQASKAKAAPAAVPRAAVAAVPVAHGADGTMAARFLVDLMAERVGTPADQIDTELGYYELGLDSAKLLDLVGALEAKVGASLAPTLLFEYTTISELAAYLAEKYPDTWQGQADSAAPALNAAAADVPLRMPSASAPVAAGEDIAVIGMAGRYPGADTLEQFWENLKAGTDSVTEIPAGRWERSRLEGVKSPSGKEMSRWGGFINDLERFDAQFFRVSPFEAKLLDPQQRQFLEVCWEAIEDAGYTPKTLVEPRGRNQRRRVGVYAGVMHNDYALLTAEAVARGSAMPISLNYAQIANRVSYFCNFHGPSMAIDTVCSSSLIAVHMAMESLRSGECEVALAGGVNLSVHPSKYMTYGMMDMHASDGRCRSFGAGGDGYVSGEGVGTVVLKPLSAAVRDGDHIYAVVKGSTTNHVGAVSGLTVPSPVAQADMIEECLEKTGIHPRTISYVEAHGTGTSLGDPIEIQGLVRAFGHYTSDRQYCAIGSVKSNIGHAESAAGISGLAKVALQLRHKTLVPSLHAQELNPYLDFANSPFFVQHTQEEWRQPIIMEDGREVPVPRRAALSSFGASGSNAHLILEEYTGPQRAAAAPRTQSTPVVVPLSAKKADRLDAAAARLLEHVRAHGAELDLPNLAYTLQVGREAMEERVAFVVSSIDDLAAQLQAFVGGAVPALRATVRKGKRPAVDNSSQMMADGRIDQLAQAWLEGAAIDWAEAHRLAFPDTPAQRVSLPAYPFARERHWLEVPVGPAPVAAAPASGDTLYFAPRWKEMALEAGANVSKRKTTVFVVGSAADAGKIGAARLADEVVLLQTGGDIAVELENHARQLLMYCKDSERIRRSESELLLVYAPHRGSDYPYRSLMGALRTIAMELPFIKTRLVLDAALAAGDAKLVRDRLRGELAGADSHSEVAYAPGQARKVQVQQLLDHAPVSGKAPLAGAIRQQGVYLITGGMGGLGMMFAEHMGRDTGARIVLTGRSTLGAERKAELAALAAKGIAVDYASCDTSSMDDVQRLIDSVVAKHGALHGVIHSAGVVADNFIPRKTVEEVAAVFAAKVPSIVNLDRATANLALDFFVSFSSIAAMGNAGQFDYATANAFLDSFSGERAAMVLRGERHGKSLSINWPLWKDGGMSVAPAYEKFMFDKYGVVPLQEDAGVRALASALASSEHQFGVFQGERQRIAGFLAGAPAGSVQRAAAGKRADTDAAVLDAVSQALGMAAGDIDPQTEFADYGMDSIGATKIASHLNDKLGIELTGAVFMELSSTAKLMAHLRENVIEESAQPVPETPAPQVSAPVTGQKARAAIVGYDARLPGAADVETYWRKVQCKEITIGQVPPSRWKERGVTPEGSNPADYSSMQHAALLDDIDGFDAAFWDIDDDAAREMDPQARMLLKSIWHCVEHAGVSMKELTAGRVGLFLALDSSDYQTLANTLRGGVLSQPLVSVGMFANRISYLCNFTGPSEAIDNACASTYVALKRAAQALANGECDSAIVGGAKVLLDPAGFRGRDEGEILSRSGLMYPFDAQSDGYVRGEGVGCVLLKDVERATQDGSTIHAVVAGVGVTHNGRATLSPLAPSVDGQFRAIREAYRAAGVSPASVSYIEAHGTSNSFSDAAEMAAFKQFFKEEMDADSYRAHRVAVSTVKANIGHLEGASGVASLIKAICAIRDRKIAPTATWSKLHPSIMLDKSPFWLPTEVTPWQAPAGHPGPLRMGLHSIGIGGVNAHVILEEHLGQEAPATAAPEADGPQLVVISAKTRPALEAYRKAWHAHLDGMPQQGEEGRRLLAQLAITSQRARDSFAFRAAYVVSDLAALKAALALCLDRIEQEPIDSGDVFAAARAVPSARGRTPTFDADTADLKPVALAWLAGSTLVWKKQGRARQVPIPQYPFHDRKVWIGAAADPFDALFQQTFMAAHSGDMAVLADS